MRFLLPRAAALAALVLLATACAKTDTATPSTTATRDDNLALGNPSGAVASTSSPTNYLLVKPQYTVGYNRDQGKPVWVSWHLNSAWLGSATRQDDFRTDVDLPAGWYQVKTNDYTGSGFDHPTCKPTIPSGPRRGRSWRGKWECEQYCPITVEIKQQKGQPSHVELVS